MALASTFATQPARW